MDISTSRKKRWRTLQTFGLMLLSCTGYTADQSRSKSISLDEPTEFNIPELLAVDAASHFTEITGVNVQLDSCHDVYVGPLRGLYTPRKAWTELFSPLCLDLEVVDSAGLTPALVARERGSRQYDFKIARQSRAKAFNAVSKQAGGLLLGYLSLPDEEDDRELVGPFKGRMSVQKILELVVGSADLAIRWAEDDGVSIEPRQEALNKKSRCACTQNLIVVPPPSEQVLVERTRLPELGEYISAPVLVMDRQRIAELGVSSVPDLLRYVSQTAFTRGRGYRVSGAQFAEMRGLGAEYTLVLINGHRAFGSASDLFTSAFDLNSVPITAVEQVEVSFDSASLKHGTDAINGVVNIVLRSSISKTTAEVRYEAASGGAAQRGGAVSTGIDSDRAHAAVVIDFNEADELLGAERDRWRDQNFTRYGGTDQRSRFSAPATIRSLNGQNLPGLNSPFAAATPLTSGGTSFRPGEINLSSLLAWQAIVPATKRGTFSGIGSIGLGASTLSGEALLARRETRFRLVPEILAGSIVGADHPENPFGIPVAVDAVLSGLPQREQIFESDLLRGVVELTGPMRDWIYSASAIRSTETATLSRRNSIDRLMVMRGLSGTDAGTLSLFTANPGENAPADTLRSPEQDRYLSGGTQLKAGLSGRVLSLPTGEARAELAVEHREEFANFDRRVGTVDRDVNSMFGALQVPIFETVDLTLGARRDHYSDVGSILREQYGMTWRSTPALKFHVSYGESFRAPSLYDLHFPRSPVPAQIFDPRRNETASVRLMTGGNPGLAPTTGRSWTVGGTFTSDRHWRATFNLWQLELDDRISLSAPQTLLAYEATAISGRIVREDPNDVDLQANRPGRLTSLDISRANFGEAETRGVYVTLDGSMKTARGSVSARLDITYTDTFRYSDIPSSSTTLRDRVGIASELGTITSAHAIASFGYERDDWQAHIFGRYHSAYDDYVATAGTTTGQVIEDAVLLDTNISKKMGKHVTMTFGVRNVLDQNPPFAEVGGPAGFDLSQGDLIGREFYLRINGSR